MRNRYSIQFTTFIIILSLITVFTEFSLLYFLDSDLKATLISCGIVLVISIILLFRSYHFEAVFIYTLLNVVLSGLLAAYRFWEIQYFYYSVTNYNIWMVICNFFVPFLFCLIIHLFDVHNSFSQYKGYFRNNSILFYLCYFTILAYTVFSSNTKGIWSDVTLNLIPFYTIAGYIENYIYHIGSLNHVLTHLLIPTLLYLPVGFLIGLLLRKNHKILRFFTMLLFLVAIEITQYMLQVSSCNIDDIIYGFIGCLIGQLIFLILNKLSNVIKGHGFLQEESQYRSTLHF